MGVFGNFNEVNRPDTMLAAEGPEDGKETEQEAEVTDTVHDKGLLGGIAGTLLFKVVADQQVGTEADTFPADKHDQGIVTKYQHQHGEDEQVQVTEVAVEALFTVHITDGVEMNQGADTGDDHDHHGRQRVKQEAPINLQVTNRHPGGNDDLMRLDRVADQLEKVLAGDQERKEQRACTNRADDLLALDEPLAKQPVNNTTEQREEGY